MRIKGQGYYEDKNGNEISIMGAVDVPDTNIKSITVKGDTKFDSVSIEDCSITGKIKGNILKCDYGEICGSVDISEINGDKVNIRGTLSCKNISTSVGALKLHSDSKIACIVSKETLQISAGQIDANVDLELEIPFLKLKVKTSKGADATKNTKIINIDVVKAKHVELTHCKIGKLSCHGGRLNGCYIDTLICGDDINISDDCVIIKRLESLC